MTESEIKKLLEGVRRGRVTPAAALERLRRLPFEDLGFAKIDHHRSLRQGYAEVIYAPGKRPEQVVSIVRRMARNIDDQGRWQDKIVRRVRKAMEQGRVSQGTLDLTTQSAEKVKILLRRAAAVIGDLEEGMRRTPKTLPRGLAALGRAYGMAVRGQKKLQLMYNPSWYLKNFVDIRPIRHWLQIRVRAHVFICILSLLLKRILEIHYLKGKCVMEPLEEISKSKLIKYKVKFSKREDRSQTFPKVTNTTPMQRKYFNMIGIRNPMSLEKFIW